MKFNDLIGANLECGFFDSKNQFIRDLNSKITNNHGLWDVVALVLRFRLIYLIYLKEY